MNCQKCGEQVKSIYRGLTYRRGFMYDICPCGFRYSRILAGTRPRSDRSKIIKRKPRESYTQSAQDEVSLYFEGN